MTTVGRAALGMGRGLLILIEVSITPSGDILTEDEGLLGGAHPIGIFRETHDKQRIDNLPDFSRVREEAYLVVG